MRDRTEFAPLKPTRSTVPAPARYGWGGPGSLLALPSGSIASDLRAIGFDARRKVATYELLVANETISPVATFAYAVGQTSSSMMSWSTITVPPFASIAVTLDVSLPRNVRKQRVVVELHAEDAHLTLDAEPAPSTRAPRLATRTLALAGAASVAGAAVLAFAFVQPRVVALGVPKSVIAGRSFNMAYVLGGADAGRFTIETPQGFQVRRGELDRRSGSVALTLPVADDLRSYDVRVQVSNRFGSDTRLARIAAIPPPVRPPPLPKPAPGSHALPELALSSASVNGGQAIGVSYPAANASANVYLIDQLGKTRATALLDSAGRSVLVTPRVSIDQPFKVVVRAREGNSSVESSAPLFVKAVPVDESLPYDSTAGMPSVPTVEGDLPFAVAGPSTHGGELMRVAVVHHEEGLRIALTTVAGSEVSASDVAPNQDSIALRTPAVGKATEYLIVATFRHGVSQETVVRPITLVP